MTTGAVRKAAAVLLLYDITNKASFDALDDVMKYMEMMSMHKRGQHSQAAAGNEKQFWEKPVLVLGNKCALCDTLVYDLPHSIRCRRRPCLLVRLI